MSILKIAVVLLLAGFVACTSAGRLPAKVVEMYDAGLPGGWMEIEAERDGSIIEIETDIAVQDLPPAVRAAAEKELPGGLVTGAEWEVVGGSEGFEVKMRKGSREYEFVFTREGGLLETEMSLRPDEAPAAVLRSASAAISGGRFKSVERIERGDATFFHVKIMRDGVSYKIELAADGTVLRKVREARVELEIPLK